MGFLSNIKSSIYDPAYYREILSRPFLYSFKYFLSLIVLAALVGTIFISFSIVPKINKFISEVGPNILRYYPNNLEVTVKNGKVSMNVPEPYFIKFPAELKNSSQAPANNQPKPEIDNLLAIDTKSPFTIDLFRSYKTAALLSYDSIAYYDNNAVKIQPLDKSINGVITKAKVSSALDKIMPYLKILLPLLVPIIFIAYFIGSIFGKLIYLIFGAFVIWILAKAMKKNLNYGKSYQLGLHAITLGVILEATVFWFYPDLEFPFLFTILMAAIVWTNLKFSATADNPPPAPVQMPISGGETK